MFDMGLHFRFLQKAAEAYFEMAQACVAGTLAIQSRVHDQLTSPAAETRPNDWPWQAVPMPPWSGSFSTSPSPWNSIIEGYQNYGAYTLPAFCASAWMAAPPWAPGMFPRWGYYQGPLVAAMLSYGVPYAVAAPTARAGTSAMDAADVACAQFRLIMGNDNDRPTARRRTS